MPELPSKSKLLPYPGFEWMITSTVGWPRSSGPYAWVAYGRAGYLIPTERRCGFASSLEAARTAAKEAFRA
jgi:hypothetical protein